MFNASGEPVGAQITNYLLEKGRVVGQIENERNFHIFYQFTKGASDNYRGVYKTFCVGDCSLIPTTEIFGLQGPESYAFTSMSNCLEVQDVDDIKEFHDTIVSLALYLWF